MFLWGSSSWVIHTEALLSPRSYNFSVTQGGTPINIVPWAVFLSVLILSFKMYFRGRWSFSPQERALDLAAGSCCPETFQPSFRLVMKLFHGAWSELVVRKFLAMCCYSPECITCTKGLKATQFCDLGSALELWWGCLWRSLAQGAFSLWWSPDVYSWRNKYKCMWKKPKRTNSFEA